MRPETLVRMSPGRPLAHLTIAPPQRFIMPRAPPPNPPVKKYLVFTFYNLSDQWICDNDMSWGA